MGEDRIHRCVSDDGTEIAGHVRGQGPPLVLVQGGAGDGDGDWAALLPLLTRHFTCFTPSMRGRGLSADHPDQRPERHVEDVAAFVNSIGGPVGLVGWSTGGRYGLGAAQRGARLSAVAAFEPPVFAFWAEEEPDAQRFGESVAGMMEAVGEDRLTDAARAFHRGVSNDEEMVALEEQGAFEYYGRYAPNLARVMEQASETEAPDPTDPSQLSKVTIPVLLLYGSRTTVPHARSTEHLAGLLPDVRVAEIPGAGHMAPALEPEPIAEELVTFFGAPS